MAGVVHFLWNSYSKTKTGWSKMKRKRRGRRRDGNRTKIMRAKRNELRNEQTLDKSNARQMRAEELDEAEKKKLDG